MIQRFRPLFSVAVEHSFYASRCDDFDFLVSSATVRALQGARAYIRVLQGRLQATCEVDSSNTPINPLVGHRLLIGLKLKNRFFSNFTQPVIDDRRRMPLYANQNDPLVFDSPLAVHVINGTYQHVPQTQTRPLLLRCSNEAGDVIAAQSLPPGTDSGTFDLRSLAEGSYRIDEDAGAGRMNETQLIMNPEMHHAGVWGLLAIQIAAEFYDEPATFTLKFTARQDPLKYYIVANNFSQLEFEQLNVTDNGFIEQERTQVNFNRLTSESFTADDPLPALLGEDQDRTILFQSTETVARREHGLRKIQLHRNGDILVAHLPQPAAERQQSQFVVHLSKP